MPEINFFWDPLSDNILQERDENGAVTAEYTAEPGLYGNIISQNRGGVESQFHYDAQGSTLAVTDDNQNVTDTFAYTAFGEVAERTGTTEVPFQYSGRKGYYTDGATGQIVVRRRPYEPAKARWLSADPVGVRRDDVNIYEYAKQSPVVVIDPSGMIAVTLVSVSPRRHGPFFCGEEVNAKFRFAVKGAAPCPGYIVQMVSVFCHVKDCTHPDFLACPDTISAYRLYHYWEAWRISDQSPMPGVNDTAAYPAALGYCGYYAQFTTIKFFCENKDHPAAGGVGTGDLGDPPDRLPPPGSQWQVNGSYGSGDCTTKAGRILSTGKEPSWWGDKSVRGPTGREFGLYFRCCPRHCGVLPELIPNFVLVGISPGPPEVPDIPPGP